MSSTTRIVHCLAQVCAAFLVSVAIAGGPVDDSKAPTPPSAVAVLAPAPPESTPVVATPLKGRSLGVAPTSSPSSPSSVNDGARTIAADENGLFETVLPTAGALAAVIIVILGAKWAAQRMGIRLSGGRRPSGVVEILARYPIVKGQQVMLMKVARRILVVHQSNDGMRTLAELSSAEEVADLMARIEAGDRVAKDPRFEASLQSALKGDVRGGSVRGLDADTDDFGTVETIDLTTRTRSRARESVIPNTAAVRRGLFGGRLA